MTHAPLTPLATAALAFLALLSVSLLAAPAALASNHPASAQSSEVAAASPEATIKAQLEAISNGDWEAAFSFATLNIQTQFATPKRFAAMVQGGFGFMIEPASTELVVLGFTDTSALVEALFISESHGLHRVIYSLERDAENAWRIAGVLPAETSDLAA